MAIDWRDPGQWHKGHLYIYKPKPVFAAPLDYANTSTYGKYLSTNIWYLLYFDTPTVGDANASTVKEGMTLCLGSTAGASDLGRCRVKSVLTEGYTGGSEKVIQVFASDNIFRGEISPAATSYITVYNLYEIWAQHPYYGAYNAGYYDGDVGPGGTTYNQFPIANAGAPYAGYVDPVTGLATVSFSGADSFSMAVGSALGQLTDLASGATVSAETEAVGHPAEDAVDGDGGTYWEATATNNQYFTITLGADSFPRQYSLTANGSTTMPANWTVWGDGSSSWVLDSQTGQTGWSAGETRTYNIDRWLDHGFTSIRFNFGTGASANMQMREIEVDCEDRVTTSPYTWDVDDGTITVGSATTEDITATFPPGVRYVELTVTDTNAYDGVKQVPVVTGVPKGAVGNEYDYTGATADASTTYSIFAASNVIDDNNLTYWYANASTGWIRIYWSDFRYVSGYSIYADSTTAPKDWTFEGSNDGSTWDTIDTQSGVTFAAGELKTYALDTTYGYKQFRLNITDNGGSPSYVGMAEFNLLMGSPPGFIDAFEVIAHHMDRMGQTMTFRVYDDIDIDDFPPGTLVMYWEDEYFDGVEGNLAAAGPTGRTHMKFWGWIDNEPTRIEATDTGTRSYVDLQCVDVGGRLQRLPAFPLTIERESSTPSYVYQMINPNIDRYVYLLLRWFSTAAQVTDWIRSGTMDHWAFCVLGSQGGTLWQAVDDRCMAIGRFLTCNKHGRLQMPLDQQLLTSGQRSSDIQIDIDETDWVTIDYTQQSPRYHWNWGSGLGINRTDADAAPSLTTYFCVSPGETPGQGAQSNEHGEQLLGGSSGSAYSAQTELNQREGNRYAVLNAPQSQFRVRLVHGNDTGIDPAEADVWVRMTISAANAAQRGLSFTDERFLVVEVNITYDHDAMTKTVDLVLERETEGQPAETYTP